VTDGARSSDATGAKRISYTMLAPDAWPIAIRFMLGLDDETLWRRFKSTRTARSILDHFDTLRPSDTRFFAAHQEEIIALAELYAFEPDWSRAELVITCHPRAEQDHIFGELSQLALFEIAQWETRELLLDRQDYSRRLARYFDHFPIIAMDEERVHLSLIDDA